MPPPATLMPEIVEDILLRVPRDDPATLARAALACGRWRRLLVADAGFRRRYRGFHGAPPMLGFIRNLTDGDGDEVARFVPTSSLRGADRRGMLAVDSPHGRVLLCTVPWREDPSAPNALVVWDPVADRERVLPALARYPYPKAWNWNAAVLAPAAACDGGCSCCGLKAFLVVFVGVIQGRAFACVYSSEVGAWSEPTNPEHIGRERFGLPPVLARNALYYTFHQSTGILKYDLATREVSVIHLLDTLLNSAHGS